MFTLLPLEEVEAALEAHNVSVIRLRHLPGCLHRLHVSVWIVYE